MLDSTQDSIGWVCARLKGAGAHAWSSDAPPTNTCTTYFFVYLEALFGGGAGSDQDELA